MLQGDFCFALFYFAKLEIKGNPWLKSAVPDSAMPHHLWCCVTDQRFDLLGLLPDLDLQSHCSNQCRFRTREWRVLLQHKAGERKGRLGEVYSLMAFFSAASEKREKTKLRKPGKTRRKGPQGTKNSQRTSVHPGSLSWSTAPRAALPSSSQMPWQVSPEALRQLDLSSVPQCVLGMGTGRRLQDYLTWDLSWTRDRSPSCISTIAKCWYRVPQNGVLRPGVEGRLLHLFPISVKKFPTSDPKPHPFCSTHYRMYETSEPNPVNSGCNIYCWSRHLVVLRCNKDYVKLVQEQSQTVINCSIGRP